MNIEEKVFLIWLIGFVTVILVVYLSSKDTADKLNDSTMMVFGLLFYAAL